MKIIQLFLLLLIYTEFSLAQLNCTIDYTTVSGPINSNLDLGVFYVPKTNEAAIEFANCGIQFGLARTNVIETVINSSSNLSGSLSLLNTVETQLQDLSSRCEKLIFIFEKMPAWLSSSNDASPAATPGWAVLHTKAPANWNAWQAMVDSITHKIVVDFGITNAYFEIWNEPDLGSWTSSKSDYFLLYKKTFDAIKQVNNSIPVGGPTLNFWGNNLNWQAPYGYISNSVADSSLIGELLDSSIVWNKIPDFISFHNFNLSYQEFKQASDYLTQKYSVLSISPIPIFVSEWNAPSAIRDQNLATAFLIKNQLEISQTNIEKNAIAAWQDFSSSSTEFHADYGLISYGGIHKPIYYATQLSHQLKGNYCQLSSNSSMEGVASIQNDTLQLLISNYAPPAIVEALNHTLYEGHFNINDLDQDGYINIATSSLSPLDSIYAGYISIGNSSALEQAIQASIPVYAHYDSLTRFQRNIHVQLANNSGNGFAKIYVLDSIKNNNQWKYDSLRAAGMTQSSAISYLLSNQELSFSSIPVINGALDFTLQQNAVALIEIALSELSLLENSIHNFACYPNPSSGIVRLEFNQEFEIGSKLSLINSLGETVRELSVNQANMELNLQYLPKGIYTLKCENSGKLRKLVLY